MIISLTKDTSIIQHKGLRQFVKFCIVGATSTVVNLATLNTLHFYLKVPLVFAITIAFVISVINGFIWNRHWTFKESRHQAAHEQSIMFFLVNIVGWLLNTSIVVLLVCHFTSAAGGFLGDQKHVQDVLIAVTSNTAKTEFSKWLVNGSQLAATVVVVFWNFFANRKWTFKQ